MPEHRSSRVNRSLIENLETRRLLASIGDLVWNDLNNSKTQDGTEAGIAGVTLRLFQDDGDGVFDPSTTAPVWINEIHYDNTGTDVDEGFEIAGKSGTDLKDWAVVLYNGGAPYGTVALTGSVPNQAGGFGAVWFAEDGLQNGEADGMALVNPAGQVTHFISYEGPISATSGPASGLNSFNLPVAEATDTPVNQTLQLTGTGGAPASFTWTGPVSASRGQINAGQTVTAPPVAGDTFKGTDVTDAAGVYGFAALGAGTYWVDVDAASPALVGKVLTTAPEPRKVTVSASQNLLTVDFGYRTPPTTGNLGDKVFRDTNGNGTLDAGETGIGSVPLKLYRDDGDGVFEPGLAPPALAWINELHYDNDGTDIDEGFEIAGKTGTDLKDWSVALYNGGDVYGTVALTGLLPDQVNGSGALWFARSGLQNGTNDGLALVNSTGQVVDFISYEGPIAATTGPAGGRSAVEIPVSELADTPAGQSLQRTGTGGGPAQFTWTGPVTASRGQINTGQTINSGGAGTGQDFLVDETVTNASGTYGFSNLAPGAYWVDVTQTAPALNGLNLTAGTEPRRVTIVAGAELTNVDFGYRASSGSAAGLVFNDVNANGVRDTGEATLASRTVFVDLDNDNIFDAGEPSASTNASGTWRINNLSPGNYKLRQVVPQGWRQTKPTAGVLSASVSAGQVTSGLTFGTTQKGLISGVVFNDTNADQIRQNGEAGRQGWRVFLDTDNDGVFDTGETSVLTSATGAYTFNNLAPGTYRVRAVQQVGFTRTTPAGGVFVITLTSGLASTGKLFGQKAI